MGGEKRGPWTRHSTERLLDRGFFGAFSDDVIDPSGRSTVYDWIDVPDLLRVAALTADGQIHIVEQYHYLPQRVMWQLPGGSVNAGESPSAAAARELAEETGLSAGSWRSLGAVWPMPGLTPARVHLWVAEDLRSGEARLEASEAGLIAEPVPISQAVAAVLDGTVGCAASAQMILTVAAGQRGRS